MEKEKLSRFLSAVNSVTDKQVNDIISEAQQERDSILSSALAEAKNAEERHVSDNLKMISGKYIRMVSKAELDMKKEVLLKREELTGKLFERVADMLRKYTSGKEYGERLVKEISGEELSDNSRIFLSPNDMRFEKDIRAACKGINAEISADENIKYGGFCILRTDRGTVTDRTFDCALREQQSLFASKNLMASREGQKN